MIKSLFKKENHGSYVKYLLREQFSFYLKLHIYLDKCVSDS